MTDVESFVPSDRAMRRALLRADVDVPLDASRPKPSSTRAGKTFRSCWPPPRGSATRVWKGQPARSNHLFAQGLHPAHAPLPAPLPLLHLRQHAGEPDQGRQGPFLSPDDVLDIARAGAALGCKEALFTRGDRPEDRWPVARKWLDAHGYDSTRWGAQREQVRAVLLVSSRGGSREVRAVLARAEQNPAGPADVDYLALLTAEGQTWMPWRIWRTVRKDTVGDEVGYLVNRNINFTNVCCVGCRFCAFAQRKTNADAFTLSLAQVGSTQWRV